LPVEDSKWASSAAALQDGTIAAALNGGRIEAWDASGAPAWIARGQGREEVHALAAGTGGTVVSGWDGGRVRVHFRGAERESAKLPGAGKAVFAVAVSPVGGMIAAGDAEGRLFTRAGVDFAPAGGETLQGGVRALAFSPDGRTLAAGSEGGDLVLLDPASGKARKKWALLRPVSALLFADRGKTLYAGLGSGATLKLKIE
jgi:WD40 repeat protein